MEKTIKYRIYPSLLDKFQELLDYEKVAEEDWNKISESAIERGEYPGYDVGDYKLTPDEMYVKLESDLINSINRCPKDPNEAADKGTAFNEIVDCLIENRKSSKDDCNIYSMSNKYGIKVIRAEINGFVFDYDIALCEEAASYFAGSLTQFFAQSIMDTTYGNVEIYGYIDEWPNNKMFDIKTTGRYTFGKFERKWQRHAYPWCVINSGLATEIESFTYWVVEWAYQRVGEPLKAKSITPETYTYDHNTSETLLRNHIEKFIEWIELRREFIQDQKIFGGNNPEGWSGQPVDIKKLEKAIFDYKLKSA